MAEAVPHTRVNRGDTNSKGDKEIKFLLTVREVAERFGVSNTAVQQWINDGHLQAYRLPGSSPRSRLFVAPIDAAEFYKLKHGIGSTAEDDKMVRRLKGINHKAPIGATTKALERHNNS